MTADGSSYLVPEPSSCVLLLGSLLFGLGIRRRK
ncbi:PEP-CTERM sorting domain-containing protein [Rubritalea profundi]|uniref:Ice-binding protein C-terminal domain-containing protein n=1 Tax=Rubritalea profundi TaxID=1658618 RepID=A0A2S7U5G1_9BACT|nr:hypothetical protein BSZ32_04145 [Rubritalea profundi]